MSRVLAWLVAALAALLLAVLGALVLAVNNDRASAWLVAQAVRFAPGELSLTGAQGDLLGGMQFAGLRYTLDGNVITARDLHLQVRWADLLERRLTVRRAHAATVDIELAPGDAAASPVAGPPPPVHLPLDLRVDALQVASLHLRAGGFDETLADLSLAGVLAGTQLQLRELSGQARGVQASLAGELKLAGDWPLSVQTRWRAAQPGLAGEGSVTGDLRRLRLRQTLTVPDTVVLQAEWRDPLAAGPVTATLTAERLRWPPSGGEQLSISDARLRLEGRPDDYAVDFAGLAGLPSLPSLPALEASLQGRGTLQALQISSAQLRHDQSRLTARGELQFAGPAVTLELEGSQLDPALVSASLDGRLDATAHLQWRAGGDLVLAVERLNGRFLGQPLDARGRLRQRGAQLQLAGLRARSGDGELQFDGQLAPSLAGRFEIRAPSLARFWPGLAGSLSGEGDVGGSLAAPRVNLSLHGADLRYGSQAAAELDLAGHIDAGGELDWVLTAEGLQLGAADLGRLQATARGRLDDHAVQLALSGGVLGLTLASHGRWDAGRLDHEMTSGLLRVPAAGQWRLAGPFAWHLAAGEFGAGAQCWRRDGSSLCFDNSLVSADQLSLDARLEALPMALLQPWLGERVTVTGTADAQLKLRRQGGELALDADWQQGETRLAVDEVGGERVDTAIRELTLALHATEASAQLTGRLRGDYGVAAELAGTVTTPLSESAPLDLRLQLQVPDLAEAGPLLNRFAGLEAAHGQLAADLHLGGTRADPELSGEAHLTQGSAFLPAAGIDLQAVSLDLSGTSGQALQLTGSARSGGGQLLVDGLVDWSETAGLFADLTVRGEAFQAVRFPGQEVYISPDLRAHLDDQRITLTGQLQVPKAEVRVDALPQSATAPSNDVVVHRPAGGARPRSRRGGPELVGSVAVILGEDVRFAGFGLDTRLGGQLRLLQPPGGVPPRAEGVLRTEEGRFKVSGKELRIERGVLVFAGPLEDPTVDVRATRSLRWEERDITVGVLLTGPLSALQTQVFGEPAMSETDALSYLVLDRPATAIAGDPGAELSGTAVALGLVRVLPVAKELEDRLSLDEVGLEGSGGENTAVVAGKWLSEDLFVRYSYGLFNRIGTFIVRYRVGGGFSIEAGSGQEQSLDLIYSIDR